MNHTRTACRLATLLLLALPVGLVAPAQPAAKTTRFTAHLIKDGYKYCYGIAAADLDGDGPASPGRGLAQHRPEATRPAA